MKAKKRQKMCHNCEGEIDLDVIVCPFCAADLREERPESPVAPPNVRPLNAKGLHQNLYSAPHAEREESSPLAEASQEQEGDPAESLGKSLSPIVFLTLGVQLFAIGVLLLLFSDRGTLTLKWDARLWFLYVFAAIPLVLFGYRSLKRDL